jgi:zinc protease
MKFFVLLLFTSSLFIALSCKTTTPEKVDTGSASIAELGDLNAPIPIAPYITKGTLKNGLTYYIRQNKKPENRAELRLVINAGSILEDSTQQGLAHLLEHMCFNGTQNFKKQELVDFLESAGLRFGPDLNAYTSFDETVYMLQLPTDSLELLEKGFLVLEDWAHNVLLEDDEIEKERGVVIEEWRLGQGANRRIFNKQLPIIMKNSQYAKRLPIGKKEILETFSPKVLKRFYKDFYRPNLMAVVAVGDFEIKQIEKMIKKHFAHLKNPLNEAERTVFEVPEHKKTLYAIAADKEARVSSLTIAYKKKPKQSQTIAEYRSDIVERLYHTMFNSRLSDIARSENPPFVYAYSGKQRWVRQAAMYTLGAMVKDNGIPKAFEALLTEAKRVRQFGFSKSELERAKKQLLRGMEKAFSEKEKTESRSYAAEYIRNFLTQEVIPGIEYEYNLYQEFAPQITLAEINQLNAELITDDNRVVIVSTPEKEGLITPTQNTLSAILAEVENSKVEPFEDDVRDEPLLPAKPKAGKIIAEKEMKDVGLTVLTLSNGIKVILKETDFQNDEIRFSASSPGGFSLVKDENIIAAQTAASIINESGVGNFNAIQLRKKLAGKMVNGKPYIGRITEGFSGSASPKDLETLFQLVYLNFNAPRKDATAYETYKSKLTAFYQNKNANPESAFMDTIRAVITNHQPRYRSFGLDRISEMDLEKSLRIYEERFADAGDFTFYFVGNFEKETIKPFIKTYLGSLKATNSREKWGNQTYETPRGIIKRNIYKGVDPKGMVSLTFSGDYDWTLENNAVLNTMKNAFNIKLREILREDKGGTYGVRTSISQTRYPKARYQFSIRFGCDPIRTEELINEVFTQIDSLKQFGLDEKYLNKVKEQSLRSQQTNLKKNHYWINKIEFADFNLLNIAEVIDADAMVQKRTMEEVVVAANRYLDTENYIQVVLYPENMKR